MDFKVVLLKHPPYSSHLVTSDFRLFQNVQKSLGRKPSGTDQEVTAGQMDISQTSRITVMELEMFAKCRGIKGEITKNDTNFIKITIFYHQTENFPLRPRIYSKKRLCNHLRSIKVYYQ